MTLEKPKIYALAGSFIGCILVFLILWLVYMPYIHREEDILEEGIMVSFGDSEEGAGNNPLAQEAFSPPQPSQSVKSTALPSEPVLTQKNSPSLVVPDQKKIEEQNRQRELLLQQQAEQRRAAEQKRREQEAIARANNAMSGAFGNGGSSTGSGNTSGDGRQGNPAGRGVSGGNSWSLDGRSLVGNLARPPYSSNEEGRITVSIRVDANGKVTSATISSPTNISDASMRSGAISAAKNTRFSSGSGVVVGTITYVYKLN